MSFRVPFWPHTEPGSARILVCEHLEATLVQRMLFIAFMAVAKVSPNVFCSQVGLLLTTYKQTLHYLWVHAHIHLCYMTHSIRFIYITFMHNIYTFFFLYFFWSSWQAGCPWFLMSDTPLVLHCCYLYIQYMIYVQCIQLWNSRLYFNGRAKLQQKRYKKLYCNKWQVQKYLNNSIRKTNIQFSQEVRKGA